MYREWTVAGLDLQILGSQPVVMPKNLSDHWCKPMIRKHRQLVTDEPVEFEKNCRLKLKTAEKSPIVLRNL